MYGHALRFANRFTHPLSLFLTWAYTHKHYCKNTTSSRLPVHHVHFSPSSPTLLHLTLPIRTRLGAQSVPKEVLHASSMLTVSWVWHRGSGSLFHNLSLHAQAGLTCVAYFTKTHTHTQNRYTPTCASTSLTSVLYFIWHQNWHTVYYRMDKGSSIQGLVATKPFSENRKSKYVCHSPGCPPRGGVLLIESLSTCPPSPSYAAETFKQRNVHIAQTLEVVFWTHRLCLNQGHCIKLLFTYKHSEWSNVFPVWR